MNDGTIFGIPIQKDENGRIFGMEEADFWAGYAEFRSEMEHENEYGRTVPEDEDDVVLSLGDRFLLGVLSSGIEQMNSAPKMLNPGGVERAKVMYAHLSKVFNGSGVEVCANLFDPGALGCASFDLSAKKITITKENMPRFLKALLFSRSIDIWATLDAVCKMSISIEGYWETLGGCDKDDENI